MVTGCVAGLATITPASGYVGPMGALVMGMAGGALCVFAVNWVKLRLKIDDSLDVFAVHGVGGMLGSVLVAVFAAKELGGVGYGADLNMASQLGVQVLAVGVTALWSGVATFVLVKILAPITGLRVSAEEENEGSISSPTAKVPTSTPKAPSRGGDRTPPLVQPHDSCNFGSRQKCPLRAIALALQLFPHARITSLKIKGGTYAFNTSVLSGRTHSNHHFDCAALSLVGRPRARHNPAPRVAT